MAPTSNLVRSPVETWQAINSVRVVRKFRDEPIEEAHLERILHAGRRTGSSKNDQHWAFIVIRDREHLAELAAVGDYAGHLAGASVAIALVTPNAEGHYNNSVMWDCGRAAQNMVLAAWELGIGSVPATVYEQDRARELLGYPAGLHCEFLLSFGFPANPDDLTRPPHPGGRKPLDGLVHEERWSATPRGPTAGRTCAPRSFGTGRGAR